MEFRVYFKHMDSSLALYAYAEKKLGERIAKYVREPVEVLVTMSRDGDLRHSVSCQVIAGARLSVSVEHSDPETLYSCVDILADKLDRRLRQQKEKLRSHRPRGTVAQLDLYRAAAEPQAPREGAIDAAEIIRFEPARKRMLEQRLH